MALIIVLVLAALFSLWFFLVLVGTVLGFLPWLLVGLLVGWIASALTHRRHGVLGNIGIGLAGSIIGGVLYTLLTGQRPGGPFSLTHIVMAVIGAVLLLLVINALQGRRPARNEFL